MASFIPSHSSRIWFVLPCQEEAEKNSQSAAAAPSSRTEVVLNMQQCDNFDGRNYAREGMLGDKGMLMVPMANLQAPADTQRMAESRQLAQAQESTESNKRPRTEADESTESSKRPRTDSGEEPIPDLDNPSRESIVVTRRVERSLHEAEILATMNREDRERRQAELKQIEDNTFDHEKNR